MTRNLGAILGIITMIFYACAGMTKKPRNLKSADENLHVQIGTDAMGQPFFLVYHQDALLLDTSYLGVRLEDLDMSQNMSIREISPAKVVVDNYRLLHGKKADIQYEALQYQIIFEHSDGYPLVYLFNLSKDGLAFSYQIPDARLDTVSVLQEIATYGFLDATMAWMQPMSEAKSGWRETNPSYEEHYLLEVPFSTQSPIGEGFVFPALFRTDSTWLLLSEANVHRNYCGSRLRYDSTLNAMSLSFPQAAEVFPGGALHPNGRTPFVSPWRTIAIGTLADIVGSTLGTDLATPASTLDTDFIKGGLSSWSWVLLKDDFTNYETSRAFIDYAAEMNWPYCLIDADWDWKIGYDRMQELIDYAATKDVRILLWYNSSGSWNSTTYTPKNKLVDPRERKAEVARLQQMGVAGLKVDFFGGDGQSMIAYYHDILQDAADHQLMLNFHGATLPRGWHRTYPNLMTVEAIKGQEFITFEQANADMQPSHCTVIPFTRNVYDPMDFTPMVLDSIPNIERRTTSSFELALPILFTSGIQHIAEIPAGMQKMPIHLQEFLQDIPTLWDESKLLQGFPGKEVVLGRRKGSTWFIVGINGEQKPKSVELDLEFAEFTTGILYSDNGGDIPQRTSFATSRLDVQIPAYGGFVIKLEKE